MMSRQSSTCAVTQDPERSGTRASATVTVFVCANCARPPQAPTSAGRPRPLVPNFAWPIPVREVLVPCTGRLQPEHVLKAFESGSDLVCAIACRQDNCHYLEGSTRCARRIDYLRSILQEIGLGGERLLYYELQGTAFADTALAAGRRVNVCQVFDVRVAAIRDRVMRILEGLPPNPLHAAQADKEILNSCLENDNGED
jgi:coenzyme F420-reducing hydrogenase delta subunit